MRLHYLILVMAMISCFSLPAQSANCRAGAAAQAGAQAGYERAKKAAESWSQRENQISRELQQCLGSISTSITVPTFPDLSGVLNGIKDRICRAARDKIRDYIPSKIDPWGDLPPVLSRPINTPVGSLPPLVGKNSRPVGIDIGKSLPQITSPTQRTPATPAPKRSVSDSSGDSYLFTR
ncbi:hypothetical protein Xmau_03843 [Xenorhabdus mauleonii]|uniref:TraL protein n=1 Tax=Xenorhabdus mauleonii TaxID=351675 RepID=A0A1I3V736_9GAMM|nr:hypothetical protein [Xenorhabdus mauleonii]PHM37625.1 hypothetical protein Xmau_03843 [Xenorhabdus mauleonii]SFJ90146.1 TraL protein [Xenorhabdus mauleonii]